MIKSENGGFGSTLRRSRGKRGLSGVTHSLSVIVVDIISIIRHSLPLLGVSECGCLGIIKAVGDSCNAGGCGQRKQVIIPGTENIM